MENEKPKRRVIARRHHSEEVWAQARRDYLAGYTASVVAERYGMTVDAIRKRASIRGWCKAHHLAAPPPPLHPFPEAAAATQIGAAEFVGQDRA